MVRFPPSPPNNHYKSIGYDISYPLKGAESGYEGRYLGDKLGDIGGKYDKAWQTAFRDCY